MSDTRKVVINDCFGGFGLSARGVKRLAELQGRDCYFFVHPTNPLDIHSFVQVSVDEADAAFMFSAFDVPDINSFRSPENWHEMSLGDRQAHNALYKTHSFYERDLSRHDPLLVQVVEELGEAANGRCASLKIVEIPADVEYEISEYDGSEHIAETHRTRS